jgi:hypothetical protein
MGSRFKMVQITKLNIRGDSLLPLLYFYGGIIAKSSWGAEIYPPLSESTSLPIPVPFSCHSSCVYPNIVAPHNDGCEPFQILRCLPCTPNNIKCRSPSYFGHWRFVVCCCIITSVTVVTCVFISHLRMCTGHPRVYLERTRTRTP